LRHAKSSILNYSVPTAQPPPRVSSVIVLPLLGYDVIMPPRIRDAPG
jgi:hypothetical protein